MTGIVSAASEPRAGASPSIGHTDSRYHGQMTGVAQAFPQTGQSSARLSSRVEVCHERMSTVNARPRVAGRQFPVIRWRVSMPIMEPTIADAAKVSE